MFHFDYSSVMNLPFIEPGIPCWDELLSGGEAGTKPATLQAASATCNDSFQQLSKSAPLNWLRFICLAAGSCPDEKWSIFNNRAEVQLFWFCWILFGWDMRHVLDSSKTEPWCVCVPLQSAEPFTARHYVYKQVWAWKIQIRNALSLNT